MVRDIWKQLNSGRGYITEDEVVRKIRGVNAAGLTKLRTVTRLWETIKAAGRIKNVDVGFALSPRGKANPVTGRTGEVSANRWH
ncbi:MAG: hypothetical protein IPN11_10930 [Opitutaceae bacterium]|nr:hypothetical protein [Opitutaceae bacterium]